MFCLVRPSVWLAYPGAKVLNNINIFGLYFVSNLGIQDTDFYRSSILVHQFSTNSNKRILDLVYKSLKDEISWHDLENRLKCLVCLMEGHIVIVVWKEHKKLWVKNSDYNMKGHNAGAVGIELKYGMDRLL